MPTIDVHLDILNQIIGRKLEDKELEKLLSTAKAELEQKDLENRIVRVELKDTNRPDLWSTVGLGRHLRRYIGEKKSIDYKFFSNSSEEKKVDEKNFIEIESNLKDIRPYIFGFIAEGPPISEIILSEIIQSQEKLSENYGQHRKVAAMGIYRAENIVWPIKYRAVKPETEMIPLGFTKNMSLTEIIKTHPKGIEYGDILNAAKFYPLLCDQENNVLSFPPIINSEGLGKVEAGDNCFFIELTGTNVHNLLLLVSVMACDFFDLGYEIFPVLSKYKYSLLTGKNLISPFYFQQEIDLKVNDAERLLGEKLSVKECQLFVEKMGNKVRIERDKIVVKPPPYRNDFLHSVDVIEEIAIGRGLDTFEPELPKDFTSGQLLPVTQLNHDSRDILIGLGYQEMIFNYLGSKQEYTQKMNLPNRILVEINNPMTEKYGVVRDSIIPNLLASEASSQNAVYPHKMFEIGKVVIPVFDKLMDTKTIDYCTFLISDSAANFNDVSSHLSALLFYLGFEYRLVDISDGRFIIGRCGRIEISIPRKDERQKNSSKRAWIRAGIIGEVNPLVLENFRIQMPCSIVELSLTVLINER